MVGSESTLKAEPTGVVGGSVGHAYERQGKGYSGPWPEYQRMELLLMGVRKVVGAVGG